MKKKARKRADQRSRLDASQAVKPVEKALNRLTDGTDEGRKSVARKQDIAIALFPWSNFRAWSFFNDSVQAASA